jgi:hypothetical protein
MTALVLGGCSSQVHDEDMKEFREICKNNEGIKWWRFSAHLNLDRSKIEFIECNDGAGYNRSDLLKHGKVEVKRKLHP